jgi:calcium binding protein 39
MAFLFNRNRQRSGSDLCRSTKDLLLKLEGNKDERLTARFEEDLARNLGQMKLTLQGTVGMFRSEADQNVAENYVEAEVSQQQVYALVHQLMAEDVLLPLAKNIHRLPFETRKDAQIIFSSLFRYRQPGSNNPEPPFLQYVVNQKPDIIIALCNGYDHKESAMPCGGVLREAMKHDSVSALILYDEPTESGKHRGLGGIDPHVRSTGKGTFWKFFEWIDKEAFEVSADAFSTFRVG